MAGAATKKQKSSEPNFGTKAYLISYNAVQTLGWSYLLLQLCTHYLTQSTTPLYKTVEYTVIIFQNAAVLEIMHAVTGMVRSNPIITVNQVFSRVMLVCGAFMVTQAARDTVGLPMALFAWSITEVIRYANYTFSLMGMVPHFIVYLRYTTFIVLYPIGVTGELLCLYAAQGEVGQTKLFTYEMPNMLNFIFNYQFFIIFIMLLYIPFFPQMYMHMVTQRKKVLGGPQPVKKSR